MEQARQHQLSMNSSVQLSEFSRQQSSKPAGSEISATILSVKVYCTRIIVDALAEDAPVDGAAAADDERVIDPAADIHSTADASSSSAGATSLQSDLCGQYVSERGHPEPRVGIGQCEPCFQGLPGFVQVAEVDADLGLVAALTASRSGQGRARTERGSNGGGRERIKKGS